jgi:hypothetical protein
MRFFIFNILFAMVFACAYAVNTQKPVIITFPENTPQGVIDKAMDTLRQAGGIVTHEYSMSFSFVSPCKADVFPPDLFKGFAAKASDSSIEAIKALGEEFIPIIEDDAVVSINGKASNGKAS